MYAIEMQDITKTFHGVYANKSVSLRVKKGEIHSLLGENGAGKTTLMKILFGIYKADGGRISINEKEVSIRSPHDAIDLGLSMVHQHFVLVDKLTITENIILGHEPKKGMFLDRKGAVKQVADLIDRYHFKLDPNSRIESLSVGEKQRVEILKALYNESSIILLDEPTAVLTPQEVEELFTMLRQLKEEGKTIVIITHKLKETLAIADHITILRRGETTATLPVEEATQESLAELMVGRPISFEVEKKTYEENTPVKLRLKDVSLVKEGREVLSRIDLECHSGEILGIAGVEGNGQTELIEVITGIESRFTGQLFCNLREIDHITPKKMLDYVGHIPEERGQRGFVKCFANWENMILGYHNRPEYTKNGFLRLKEIKDTARNMIHQYDVRTDGIDQLTSSLSGGNQQKLIIGRTLHHQRNMIVAAQPTRGVDIGAIEYIHQNLVKMRDEGSAILLVSADLDEVIKLSDRIAVIYEGKITVVKKTEEFTKAQLGYYMLGGKETKEEEADEAAI